MITFTELVFDQLVRNAANEVFSASRFDELLGSAYDLSLEIEVEESSGTTPDLTVKVYHSNSGKGFFTLATVVAGSSIANPPFRTMANQSGPFGKLVRLSVTLGGTTPTARVRIWATGRTHG